MTDQPTTYQTAAGYPVTVTFRPDAMYGPVHVFECGGCDIAGGRKTAEFAHAAARQHAARCTETPAGLVKALKNQPGLHASEARVNGKEAS